MRRKFPGKLVRVAVAADDGLVPQSCCVTDYESRNPLNQQTVSWHRDSTVDKHAPPELGVYPLPNKKRIFAFARAESRIAPLYFFHIEQTALSERIRAQYFFNLRLQHSAQPLALWRNDTAFTRVSHTIRKLPGNRVSQQELALTHSNLLMPRQAKQEFHQSVVQIWLSEFPTKSHR